jgi:hypothetical protein
VPDIAPRTHYSEATKARAVGLGMTQGAIAASKATGIPRRTVSRWLAGAAGDSPIVHAAILESEFAIVQRLWEAVGVGLDEVRRGLLDPKARLGEKARALEVLSTQWALLSGRATARTESAVLNVNAGHVDALTEAETREFRDWLDAQLTEARAIEDGTDG